MRVLAAGIVIALLVTGVVAIGGYAASPWLLAWGVPKYLTSLGVDESSFVFARPGTSGLQIERAVVRLGVIELATGGVEITYDWNSLMHGRAREISVRAINVAIAASDDPTVIDIPALWSLIPADRVVVAAFMVDNAVPQASIAGQFNFDVSQAHAVFGVESTLLPVPLDGRIDLDPQGGLAVSLTQRGSDVQAVSLNGVPDGAGTLEIDGDIDVAGQTFALIAGLAGVDAARGHVRGSLEGRVPWPVDQTSSLDQVALTAQLAVAATDALPLLEGDVVSGSFSLAIESGRMQVEAPALTIVARSLTWQEASYRIEDGGTLTLEVKAAMPLSAQMSAQTDDALAGVTSSIVADVALSLTSDSPAAYANAATIATRASVDVSDGQVRLTMTEDAALGIKPPTLTFGSRSLIVDAVSYAVEASGTFALDMQVALPMQSSEDPLAGVAASMTTDVTASLTSEDPAAFASHADLAARIGVDAKDGTARVAIDEGAELEFSTATLRDMAVEVRTPLAFAYTMATGALEASDVALIVRVPELALQGQRIALRSARLDIANFTWAGDRLKVAATAQTRASAKALPVSLVLDADMTAMIGKFEVAVAGNVTKPLLKGELSGWRSSYDLDRGALDARFGGTFVAPATGLEVQGVGRIVLTDAVAHYDDTIIAGLTFDLPVVLSTTGVSAGPGAVTAQQIDPGVPLTDIRLMVDVRPALIRVTDVAAGLLGGRVSIAAVDYDVTTTTATSFDVALTELQLKQVLALEGEDIAGDGVLDGNLPIQIDAQGLTMRGGRIGSRAPGGRISYRGSLGAAAAPGLDLAIQALRNFQYESLNADVDYALDGQLSLAVKLRGRSPDVEKGRSIHFNLNVSENIPALLETLRASESVTDRVQQRFSR